MTWVNRAVLTDAPALGRLMFQSVRHGAQAYSVRERAAWMPRTPQGGAWARKLAAQKVWIARGASSQPHGFVSLRKDGYVDLAFVAPHMIGHHIFSALMQRLLAESDGASLYTHASLHAQPAFAAHGFRVDQHEIVIRHGQRLQRARMRRN